MANTDSLSVTMSDGIELYIYERRDGTGLVGYIKENGVRAQWSGDVKRKLDGTKNRDDIVRVIKNSLLEALNRHRASLQAANQENILEVTFDSVRDDKLKDKDKDCLACWKKNTAASALTYFKAHTLPFLKEHYNYATGLDPSRINDLAGVFSAVSADHGGRSNETMLNRVVAKHMHEAQVIYGAMQAKAAESGTIGYLLDIAFAKPSVRNVLREQAKCLPQEVRLSLERNILELANSNPLLAERVLVMYTTGLRTSECVAVDYGKIIYRTTAYGTRYGIIRVCKQKDTHNAGSATDSLKTESAYRIVLVPPWAVGLLEDCVSQAAKGTKKEVPISSATLSAEVKTLLRDSGLSSDQYTEFIKMESSDYDLDEEGDPLFDVNAYILRRNFATQASRCCGFSSRDVDYFLGHRSTINSHQTPVNRDADFYKEADNLDELVERLNNYPHESFTPEAIDLTCAKLRTTLPPRTSFVLKNNGNEPKRFIITLKGTEPGDGMQLAIPKGAEVNRFVCSEPFRSSQSTYTPMLKTK